MRWTVNSERPPVRVSFVGAFHQSNEDHQETSRGSGGQYEKWASAPTQPIHHWWIFVVCLAATVGVSALKLVHSTRVLPSMVIGHRAEVQLRHGQLRIRCDHTHHDLVLRSCFLRQWRHSSDGYSRYHPRKQTIISHQLEVRSSARFQERFCVGSSRSTLYCSTVSCWTSCLL